MRHRHPQHRSRLFHLLTLAALLIAAGSGPVSSGPPAAEWTRWGGPHGDFTVEVAALASTWPAEGPKKLWTRELGDGYSAILAQDGRLYTHYRTGSQESVICMDAATGATVWEHRYDAEPAEGHVHQFGAGPRATPLIAGDRIYAIGVSGVMHALDKKTGKVAWKHDLWTEYAGTRLNHGYSSSPIEYKDMVIVLIGGENQSIAAFRKSDGTPVWKGLTFKNSYSTPRILNVDGEDQLVTFMSDHLIGVSPAKGTLLWKYPHVNQWEQNVNLPVMADGNHLFLSSPETGSRGLKLSRKNGETVVEEVWSTKKIQFYHVNSVVRGEYVYGSTGTMGPAFFSAVNIKTGEIPWRERGFSKANCVMAGDRLILLDEDGQLALATATPEALTVHSKAQVLDKVAWTVPTLVGKTLYLRDKKQILALDLG
jgi:outer membrane protein assembly factor BamB